MPNQLTVSLPRQLRPVLSAVPDAVAAAGPKATRRFIEFFTATIRNKNTRLAYAEAIKQFFAWCELRRIPLNQIEPVGLAAYIEQLTQERAAPTVKQHLAAIRMLFDWFVTGGIMPMNPASSVRGPRHVVTKGSTPVLAAEECRELLDAIDVRTLAGLRDRALIGCMVYSFARVSAVLSMNREDYRTQGKRSWFRFHEKGGKLHDVPAHHNAEQYVDEYIAAAGLSEAPKKSPLFRSFDRRRQLTDRRLARDEALRMIKRRARRVGLPADICNHTMRATGITAYLDNGGTIEKAQQIAAHSNPKTTSLYDRTNDDLTLDEIERVLI